MGTSQSSPIRQPATTNGSAAGSTTIGATPPTNGTTGGTAPITQTQTSPPSGALSPAASASTLPANGKPADAAALAAAANGAASNRNGVNGAPAAAAGAADGKAAAASGPDSEARIIAKHKLTKEIVEPIRALFQRYDKDGSGALELDEFLSIFQERKSLFVDYLFRKFDVAKKQSLTFANFLEVISTFCLYDDREMLKFAFECFDTDGSGSIDQAEFHTLMKVLATQHPEIPIKAIEAFDGDNDGNIDFKEFMIIHSRFPRLLWPCFRLQYHVQERTLGVKTWKEHTKKNRNAGAVQAPSRWKKLCSCFEPTPDGGAVTRTSTTGGNGTASPPHVSTNGASTAAAGLATMQAAIGNGVIASGGDMKTAAVMAPVDPSLAKQPDSKQQNYVSQVSLPTAAYRYSVVSTHPGGQRASTAAVGPSAAVAGGGTRSARPTTGSVAHPLAGTMHGAGAGGGGGSGGIGSPSAPIHGLDISAAIARSAGGGATDRKTAKGGATYGVAGGMIIAPINGIPLHNGTVAAGPYAVGGTTSIIGGGTSLIPKASSKKHKHKKKHKKHKKKHKKRRSRSRSSSSSSSGSQSRSASVGSTDTGIGAGAVGTPLIGTGANIISPAVHTQSEKPRKRSKRRHKDKRKGSDRAGTATATAASTAAGNFASAAAAPATATATSPPAIGTAAMAMTAPTPNAVGLSIGTTTNDSATEPNSPSGPTSPPPAGMSGAAAGSIFNQIANRTPPPGAYAIAANSVGTPTALSSMQPLAAVPLPLSVGTPPPVGMFPLPSSQYPTIGGLANFNASSVTAIPPGSAGSNNSDPNVKRIHHANADSVDSNQSNVSPQRRGDRDRARRPDSVSHHHHSSGHHHHTTHASAGMTPQSYATNPDGATNPFVHGNSEPALHLGAAASSAAAIAGSPSHPHLPPPHNGPVSGTRGGAPPPLHIQSPIAGTTSTASGSSGSGVYTPPIPVYPAGSTNSPVVHATPPLHALHGASGGTRSSLVRGNSNANASSSLLLKQMSTTKAGSSAAATPDQLREERKQKLMQSTNKVTATLYPHAGVSTTNLLPRESRLAGSYQSMSEAGTATSYGGEFHVPVLNGSPAK